MNKLRRTMSKARRKLKMAAPTILSVVSVIGVGGAVVTTGIATPKAIEAVKADSRKKHGGDPDAYTKMEAVLSGWKFYIPTAALTLSTMSCILLSNSLSRKQQASLIAAYSLLDRSYKEYRKKAMELYGENTDSYIREEISKDRADDEIGEEDDGLELFYFEYAPGDGYFRSTKEEVITALYHFNRNFALRFDGSVGELLEFLSLEADDSRYIIGWSMEAGIDEGYQWVDFSFKKVQLDDGLEYTIISCPFEPTVIYEPV